MPYEDVEEADRWQQRYMVAWGTLLLLVVADITTLMLDWSRAWLLTGAVGGAWWIYVGLRWGWAVHVINRNTKLRYRR